MTIGQIWPRTDDRNLILFSKQRHWLTSMSVPLAQAWRNGCCFPRREITRKIKLPFKISAAKTTAGNTFRNIMPILMLDRYYTGYIWHRIRRIKRRRIKNPSISPKLYLRKTHHVPFYQWCFQDFSGNCLSLTFSSLANFSLSRWASTLFLWRKKG